MENKDFIHDLTKYRLRVERKGMPIVNAPGIACLAGLLLAPKAGIAAMVAAPLLGCSVHLENEDEKKADIEQTVRKAAESVMGAAGTAAKRIREEIEKAWQAVSAEDETGSSTASQKETSETEAAAEPKTEEENPTIRVEDASEQ